jgi:glutamine cyclotransferase
MRGTLALALCFGIAGCHHAKRDVAQHTVAHASGKMLHDTAAFTQGLAFYNGRLFEGTGMYGRSRIRELDPASGDELRHVDVPARFFGEGITVLDGRLYELTWREHLCRVYDVDTFAEVGELAYDGEGWGLTNDGVHLISSDGSAELSVRDPKTMAVLRTVPVTLDGEPVKDLNELEYGKGYVWANVWMTDSIVRIALDTGRVVEVVDASALLTKRSGDPDDVLNGIAIDEHTGRMLVTGKRWPLVFDVTASTAR